MVLEAGVENDLKEYTVVVDDKFEKVKDGYGVKTNDTYVKIEGTNYYLYAYIDEEKIKYGLAK